MNARGWIRGQARGLRVLVVRSAFGDVHELAWTRALREMGVDARLFDTHRVLGEGLFGRLQERFLVGPGLFRAAAQLLQVVNSFRPTYTLLYQGHHYGPRTVRNLQRSTFVVGFHNDDPFGPSRRMLRYRLLRAALPYYGGYHAYRDCNVRDFRKAGVPNVALLRSYFIPWLDYPRSLSPVDARKYSSDVLFAGHPEPGLRIECLSRIARKGIGVRIYGDTAFWKKWLPPDVCDLIQPANALVGAEYRKALSGAKISACFFSRWNRDQYTRRVFEIPACGGFLLAERTPVMTQMYKEGLEAEFFSSAKEFADKVHFYIANPRARDLVARAGRRRLLQSGHDIYSRLRGWLRDVSLWRSQLDPVERHAS